MILTKLDIVELVKSFDYVDTIRIDDKGFNIFIQYLKPTITDIIERDFKDIYLIDIYQLYDILYHRAYKDYKYRNRDNNILKNILEPQLHIYLNAFLCYLVNIYYNTRRYELLN